MLKNQYKAYIFLIFFMKVLVVSAKTFVFTGVFWANGNFDLPGVPSDTDNVVINQKLCIINTQVNAKCHNLTLTQDEIVIQQNASLKVNGTTTIKASLTKAAIEISNNSKLTLIGNVSIESQYYDDYAKIELLGPGAKLELYRPVTMVPFGSVIGQNGSEIILKGNAAPKFLNNDKFKIHDLTIDAEGTYLLSNNLGSGTQLGEMNGSLKIVSGRFHLNNFTLSGTSGESITIEESGTLTITNQTGFPKGFSNIIFKPFSTVNYAATGNQNIDSLHFSNLVISGVGTKSFTGTTTVNGTIDLLFGQIETNENLTLISNQEGTGSIGFLCATCLVKGNVKIQRQIPSNPAITNNLVLGGFVKHHNFEAWNDSLALLGVNGGPNPQSGNKSVLRHSVDSATSNKEGIYNLQNIGDSIYLGEGFLVLPDSNKKTTLMMHGKIQHGDFTKTLKVSNNSNLNLVANPFPSALLFDFEKFQPVDCYSPMTIDQEGNFIPIQFQDTIHLGEGFFVLAKNAGASIKFNESLKIGTKGTSALGKGKRFNNSKSNSDLIIQLTRPDGSLDQTKINFSTENVSLGFDDFYDAIKLENIYGKANISTVKDEENLGLNLVPAEFSAKTKFPIRVWKKNSSATENYSLNLINIVTLKNNNFCISLEDKLLGLTFNIPKDTSISFQKTANDTSIRFVLQISKPIDLSIKNALCFGDTNGTALADLKGFNASYLWRNQFGDTMKFENNGFSNLVDELFAGNYTLEIKNHSECGITRIPFTITQPDSNVVAKFTANKTKIDINKNDSIIFTNFSTGALNYIWDFGTGDSAFSKNTSHYYKFIGNYIVSMTAIMETCQKTATLEVEAIDPTSIEESSISFETKIYQSEKGILNLSIGQLGEYSIHIFNISGQQLLTADLAFQEGENKNIKHNLSSGLYLIQVKDLTNYQSVNQKIFIIE